MLTNSTSSSIDMDQVATEERVLGTDLSTLGEKLKNGLPPRRQQVVSDDDGRVPRSGSLWSASAHVITAVIGSGVLSLASAIAAMGWVTGPTVLLAFGAITYYTSLLLVDSYRAPDKIKGNRNPTYIHAVRAFLGRKQVIACGIVQYVNLFGVCVGYTITTSHSLVAMGQAECYSHHGHQGNCSSKLSFYMIGFGLVQIMFSQIPDFHQLWWLSYVAAVMSLTYSSIGLGLSIAMAIGNGHVGGTLTGVVIGHGPGEFTVAAKTYQILQALGDMAFAYSFSQILLNVQDTLGSPQSHPNPPSENKTMRTATLIGIVVTTLFYMSVGCAGYAAFGNDAPGNLLTGFGFYDPAWLILLGNLCIAIHLVGAYQIFAQPIFAFLEEWFIKTYPDSEFMKSKRRGSGVSPLRLTLRTVFVIITTLLSLLFPFFNAVIGLLGAMGFWPLTIYFPIAMHMKQSRVRPQSGKWWLLHSLSVICLLVSVGAAIGSVEGIISSVKGYKPFQ